MSDCGCEKAKRALEEFLRNEVSPSEAAEIREHLEVCDDCRHEQTVAITLTRAVQRACHEKAPDELRQQILALIREPHGAAADSAPAGLGQG